ncbi:ankyrin repeat-containing domain protein [Trichoderma gracile]
MAHISILSVLLMLWLAGRAAADGGDDFANNLASDLGPIIALFGERVVMQFMSQAMGIADCILLAVAPIGAITVVVSAIRVAGPTWLKSFIGRARENVAAAEVEVMSSTSNEACELWNGHSVVRCPGSADIYQFICLLPTQHNLESLSRTQARVQCSKLEKEGDDMYLIPIENDLSPQFQIHRRVRRKELEYIDGGKQDDLLWKIETSGPGYAWRSFMKIPERLSSRIEDIFRQLASYHTSALPLIRRRTRVSPRGLDLEAASHQDQSSISTQLEIDTPESRKVSSRMSRLRFLSSRPSDKPDSNKSRLDEVKEIDEGEQDKDIIVIVDRSDDSAPNLLLNCHDRVQRGEIYLAAAFGVFLQLGALVFFGFITYDPPTKGQFFLKDGKRIVAYAFPCAAGGTVLLVLGLFICAWVVEMSTTETCYEAPNHHMFVVWLQKGRTVSDQIFSPYALYPSSPRKYITISRRTLGSCLDCKLERITTLGASVALIGFIFQFIGIRGLNWTASVVQLGITLVVTVLRVIVRRGLVKSPSRTRLMPENELDWFSLSFGDIEKAPWAFPDVTKATTGSDSAARKKVKTPVWSIRTGPNQVYYPLERLSPEIKETMSRSAAHSMMITRRNLCTLTGWKSPVCEEAARLERAIELVAQTFLETLPDKLLVWIIPARYKETVENIFITLQKRDDKWRVKDGELEAVLSLWLYSTQGEFADIDLSPNLRLYGQSHLWARLSRDFAWWMPETLPPITRRSGADITRALAHPERVVVGFMSEREDGMEELCRSDTPTTVSESEDGMEELGRSDGLTTASEPEYLVLESTDKTERIFARDLLFSFIRAVAKRPDVTIEVGGRESPNTEAWQQGNMMQLRADPISILARKLEKLGLGTLSDIHFDLIVPFILEGKTGAKDVIDDKIKQAQQYELSRQWKKLVEICSSLLELAQKFDMEKEASGPLAVAACLEFLSRLHHEADLQRQEGRSEEELMTQLRFLEEAFIYAEEQLECSGVLPGLQYSLAESRGGYATTFDMLIGVTPDATKEFPESFNIANEHRELMRASNSWERLSWAGEELGKIDSFGWSPLHYAANWQLDHVRIDIWESGDVVSLPDLMGRTPLHHACLKGNEKAVNLLLDRDALIEVAGHDGTTPIHCAVLSGNLNILKKLVEEVRSKRLKHTRESIPHVDRNKRHPIHWAAAQGCIEVVRLLRDDIVRTDRYGWACIHLAVIYKHRPLLEYIIKELSGDVNLRDNQSRTPLHLAVEFQSWKAFDVLIRAGADVKVKDRVGLTPLHKAVGQMEMAETGRTQMDIAERLIERHADVNATDTEGRTALLLAAENGMADVADFLIGHGADVSIATKDKRTALHMATKSKPITEKLLNHGADIHAKNIKGYTPLYLAVMDGIAEVAALLIDKGADVTTVAEDGRTPLHLAVRSKDITEKLLTYGADINAKDIEGYTPLYLAITEGTAEVAALLIDRGADVAIAEEDGRTPLHMALSRGEDGLEIAKKLLNFDPNVEGHDPYVNTTAEGDATPLHVAAEYGPLEAVKMLLHLGADKDQADGYGQTALLIAMYQENWDIAEELLKAGADIRADSRVGYTPLLGAVLGKQERIVEQLLRMGADVNAVDEDGYSAIHLAVSGGDPGIFGRLLRAGATIDAVTKFSSQTPLHIAVRNGDRRMVQILLEKGADTKPLNRLEFTPLQYALFRGDLVIVEEFVEHDKSSDFTAPKAVLQKGENGDTPLHTLCRYSLVQGHEYQRCEMLEKLLSIRPHGDMINAKNDEGLTPLDLAFFSFHEHPDFIRMLILSGAMGSHMVETETEESLFSSSSWDDEQGMP